MTEAPRQYLWKAAELAARGVAVTQRLNPESHLLRTGLSRIAGLRRARVSLGRVPPGKDSFAYHAHLIEEEWLYVLSGAGIAEIAGQTHDVGPGDFMAFPPPGVAHLLKNRGTEDLVYLMGGEALPLDLLDYPTLGKRFLLVYGDAPPDFYELGAPTKPFGPP